MPGGSFLDVKPSPPPSVLSRRLWGNRPPEGSNRLSGKTWDDPGVDPDLRPWVSRSDLLGLDLRVDSDPRPLGCRRGWMGGGGHTDRRSNPEERDVDGTGTTSPLVSSGPALTPDTALDARSQGCIQPCRVHVPLQEVVISRVHQWHVQDLSSRPLRPRLRHPLPCRHPPVAVTPDNFPGGRQGQVSLNRDLGAS